ncbi:MAG: hypothetical protein MMC33_007819 [Icmadophila ericetorum]|nr:hypothetical protein [Icmadophila ericetorum]
MNGAKPGYPPLFKSEIQRNSFDVRYFEQSSRHKELRRLIEAGANTERCQKIAELEAKTREYHQLLQQSGGLACEFEWHEKRGRTSYRHSPSCLSCKLKSRAQGLSVDVHEWPLPERDWEAKAVVFELEVPLVICNWRDTTFKLLVDIFSEISRSRDPEKIYFLRQYSGLARDFRGDVGRLQLASTAKSFVVAHYRAQKVSQANQSSIYVNSGLRFAIYDSKAQLKTDKLPYRYGIRKMCTQMLQPGPYESLQFAISDTSHTSNEAIAKQEACSRELTLHEFYSFAALRSGHRLQWRNIDRELTTRTLNFRCEETHTLVVQTV